MSVCDWVQGIVDKSCYMQEYCRLEYHKDAVPVTSCQELQAFYDWFVNRVGKNATGAAVIGRSWKHIATMVYFHGYITPDQWRGGGFPDPCSHYTFRQDTMRAAKANGECSSHSSFVLLLSCLAVVLNTSNMLNAEC